jgi:polyisoprenoid-binding protein YceI
VKRKVAFLQMRPTVLIAPVLAVLAVFSLLAAPEGVTREPGIAQATAAAPSNELVLALDPDKSEIHWTLDSSVHTVHGTFKFKRGELRLNPNSGSASGEIVVAATSGDSGNEGRDKKMHKDVLESARFQDIIFKPDRVEGKVAATGTSSVMVHGILTLHGTDHEFGVPVQAELSAGQWKATAKFIIPFIKWGLKNPSNFFLKVKPDVNIEATMTGKLKGAPGV